MMRPRTHFLRPLLGWLASGQRPWLPLLLPLGLLLLGLLPASALAGRVMRVGEDRLPRSFNPLYAESLVELRLSSLLFGGLFQEDRYHKITAVLASSIAPDPAHPESDAAGTGLARVFLVDLKPRIRWHNNQMMSAEDVRFSIAQLQDPALESPLQGQVKEIVKVEVLSPVRLRLTFRQPVRDPRRLLTFPILPAAEFKTMPMSRTHRFRLKPIGSGPFALDTFDTRGNLNLSRHVAYAAGTPNISGIQLLEMRDKQLQLEALRFGNLEVVVRVLPRDLPDLQGNRKIELRPYQTNNWWYLAFNLTQEPWKDPAMRQALGEMLQIDKLLEPIGGGEQISGPFVPSSPYYNHSEAVSKLQSAPASAARRLQALGYVRGSSGFWEKAGKPLAFSLAVEKDLPIAREVAVNLEGQLKRAGFQVTLEWLDAATWEQKVLKSRHFDLTLSQWSFDRSEDIFEQFHSTGRLNYVGFKHPRVDELLQRARQEVDPSARRQFNQEVHAILAEKRPYLFLWTLTQYAAFSTEVQDISIDPFNFYSQVHLWRMGEKVPPGRSP